MALFYVTLHAFHFIRGPWMICIQGGGILYALSSAHGNSHLILSFREEEQQHASHGGCGCALCPPSGWDGNYRSPL